MSAYYNEIDPNAAQWLRELIKMGAIADEETTVLALNLQEGNSFCPKACGKLGIRPRLFQAIFDLFLICADRAFRDLVYGQPLKPYALHKLRNFWALLDSFCKNESSFHQVAASALFFLCKLLPFEACESETSSQTELDWPSCNRLSKSICYADPFQSQTNCHKSGNDAQSPFDRGQHSFFATCPCISMSNIFCEYEIQASQHRTQHNRAAMTTFQLPKSQFIHLLYQQ